jgi:hypothetical protein
MYRIYGKEVLWHKVKAFILQGDGGQQRYDMTMPLTKFPPRNPFYNFGV